MPESERPQREPDITDPEEVAKTLEMELMQKRVSWQKARAHRGFWRTLSILFLLLVLIGALCLWLFLAPQLRERRSETPAEEAAS